MCGWFRKDAPEPLVFTEGEVTRILDRTPLFTRTDPDTGRTITVLRSGEVISRPRELD
jgi:hypothetical protein